jgi:signal transduction histidine kinase
MFAISCGVIYFSILADKEVYRAVTNEFMNHMREISKGSVLAIENDVNSTKRTLKLFGQAVTEHNYDLSSTESKLDLQNIFNSIDFISVNDIGFLDENGILKYNITAPQIIGMDFSFRKYFKELKKRNDPSYMYVQFIEFKGADLGEKGVIFTQGIFEEDKTNGEPVFKGVSIITSKLRGFIDNYIKPITIGKGAYMWFFESGGDILYHPKLTDAKTSQPIAHPLRENESFKKALKDIPAKVSSTGKYAENGKPVVYSASPIKIGDQKWFFVVSVPENETHAVLKGYATSYALTSLSVFAVILFGLFSLYIFYLRSRRLLHAVDIKTFELSYAKKINQELDSIINTIAHDLKSPLTSVMGFSQQIMMKALKQPLEKEDNQYISRIYFNANFMKELIDSLLEFARVGRVNSTISDVDLNRILQEVKVQLHYSIEKRNASVNIPNDLPIIAADKLKITQLFTNLLSNAIKFVPEEKAPKIDVTYNESHDYHNVSIADNGIGIDKKYIDSIFKVFHRVKDLEVTGTGVGLAIVKKIVDDVGGKITVKSQKSVGTTFTVSFKK